MNLNKQCCYCGKNVDYYRNPIVLGGLNIYRCPDCGNFAIPDMNTYTVAPHKTMAYLYYDRLLNKHGDGYIRFLGDKKQYEKYIIDQEDKQLKAIHVSEEMVENWYPKTFSEKIDLILLALAELSNFDGDVIPIKTKMHLFFCNGLDKTGAMFNYTIQSQIDYISRYLREEKLLSTKDYGYIIMPKGLARIDELQKNCVNNKKAFIAMKFGEETLALREKIKEGIELAGYEAILMDEIEHNHQIIPEMLYTIKNCRFVVAELSHHNNGAYYEAGYALGLGKEVIHICNKKELVSGLHFDVAQVNTIVYEDTNEIPAKLHDRIEATIL